MKRSARQLFWSVLAVLTVGPVAAAAEAPANVAAPASPLRGVIISCPRWGPIWGSPAMAESLREIKALGANWVAIHPYAWIRRDGSVEFRPARSLDFLDQATRLTGEAGLEMFWKPHLGYWGQFSWRGDIEFGDDEEAWRRFFSGYEAFITDQAAFAESAGVRLFAAGVELEATTHREADWRRVLAAIRRVYSGRVLYAAGWDRLDRVPFWDAVDTIGVHAYFPLSRAETPSREAIAAGWSAPLAELEALSAKHGKPVVLAEIGYNVNPVAASEPWVYRVEDTPANRELRRRLMEVAIERLERAPFIDGMFWWKWMPGPPHHRRNFALRDAEAKAVLARYWRSPEPDADAVSTADR